MRPLFGYVLLALSVAACELAPTAAAPDEFDRVLEAPANQQALTVPPCELAANEVICQTAPGELNLITVRLGIDGENVQQLAQTFVLGRGGFGGHVRLSLSLVRDLPPLPAGAALLVSLREVGSNGEIPVAGDLAVGRLPLEFLTPNHAPPADSPHLLEPHDGVTHATVRLSTPAGAPPLRAGRTYALVLALSEKPSAGIVHLGVGTVASTGPATIFRRRGHQQGNTVEFVPWLAFPGRTFAYAVRMDDGAFGGCADAPCGDHGRCLDRLVGYSCACDAGFSFLGGSCVRACSTPTTGLVAFLPFEVGGTDRAGGHHLIVPSGTSGTVVGGVLGRALNLDGIAQFAGSATLTGARSVCAWVKPAATTGAGLGVFVAGAPGQADFLGISATSPAGACGLAGPNRPYLDHAGASCVTAGASLDPARWAFTCWTYDGSGSVGLYVNGTHTSADRALYAWDLEHLSVGNSLGGSTTRPSFAGQLDEVSIWNRALTRAELDGMYSGGEGCALSVPLESATVAMQ